MANAADTLQQMRESEPGALLEATHKPVDQAVLSLCSTNATYEQLGDYLYDALRTAPTAQLPDLLDSALAFDLLPSVHDCELTLASELPPSGDKPKALIAKAAAEGASSGTSICGYLFKDGDIAWYCRTCQTDDTCVLCEPCFSASDHVGHDVFFHRTRAGGCCDCGDLEAWKLEGCCPKHRGGGEARLALPAALDGAARVVVDEIVCLTCDVAEVAAESFGRPGGWSALEGARAPDHLAVLRLLHRAPPLRELLRAACAALGATSATAAAAAEPQPLPAPRATAEEGGAECGAECGAEGGGEARTRPASPPPPLPAELDALLSELLLTSPLYGREGRTTIHPRYVELRQRLRRRWAQLAPLELGASDPSLQFIATLAGLMAKTEVLAVVQWRLVAAINAELKATSVAEASAAASASGDAAAAACTSTAATACTSAVPLGGVGGGGASSHAVVGPIGRCPGRLEDSAAMAAHSASALSGWIVRLHNDDVHTFEHVETALQARSRAPMISHDLP